MNPSLSRLFRPRSIAVFGGGWSERVVEQCQAMGFAGQIWPVHPHKTEIAGLPCYASVDALPGAPDASFVGVNRHSTIEIVAALAARQAGGAVCFASGFREVADGADLQDQLISAAGDMPILGPNCYGYINYLQGALLWPDQHGGRRTDTGVAIIAQSSNIAINLTMQNRGLPLAYVLTVGNQAQTGLAEMIEAMLEDPMVTAIGLHIEGFDNIPAVETALLKARDQGVPVVALKVGRSDVAQAMTLSHTASLAGSDDLISAFFDRMNVARVDNLEIFLETLKLLHVLGPSPDNTLGSLSCSGGEASLVGDLALPTGLDLRALTASESASVKATLFDMVTISNPLDYHTFSWGDAEKLCETYGSMLACDFGLTCLILDVPRGDRCVDNGSEAALQAAIEAVKRTGGRMAVVASLPENMTETIAERLIDAGIVPMMGLQSALHAAAAAAKIGIGRTSPRPERLFVEVSTATNGHEVLNEWRSKSILRQMGIQTPASGLAKDAHEAGELADRLGYPVVMKAVSAEMAHKSEHGAVVLNLCNRKEAEIAAQDLARWNAPLLVEQMISDPIAEIILGVSRDSQFGLYLTIGAGGVMVELLQDAVVLLLPTTPDKILEGVLSLKTAGMLTGFRNRPPGNLDGIVDAAMKIANYAQSEGPSLEELDINPLIVREKDVVAADALIRKRRATP